MKYVELKNNLASVQPVYLISGEDRYLCHRALETITKAVGLTMPEMNSVIMPENCAAEEIVEACNIYPFADTKRLVVIKEFDSKAASALKAISNYLASPMQSTVLVFFNPTSDTFFKTIKGKLCHIDCAKLDLAAIKTYVSGILNKQGIKFADSAIALLAAYCNYNMQHIVSETDKLASYCAGGETLTEDVVRALVVQDKEYQIYELANCLASGDKLKAMDMADVLGRKNGFGIITSLQNNFRRALFVAITKGTDSELASKLGIKEFAVKMLRGQVRQYSPKKLKTIVDMLQKLDSDIKQGYIKEDVATKLCIIKILNCRG